MDEKRRTAHRVSLEDRERLFVTGVTDVEEFNEDGITAGTERGMMIIRGKELHVTRLDLEKGEIEIEGEIESFEYSDNTFGKMNGSILSRIFK